MPEAKSYRRGNKYIGAMMQLADAAGCQLRPQVSDPKTMRGLCPFHQADKMQNANTLSVNHAEGRFHCQYCKTHGDATAFVGLIWGTSLAETHRLLELNGGEELSLARPTPVCMREPEASQRMWFRAQNTSLLSQATECYVQNLTTTVAPLVYMARLGIIAPDAAPSKIGYAKGWGLADFLEDTDASPDEIAQSPLFRQESDANLSERYVAALVMPDLDVLNATRWMLLLPPSCPEYDEPWPATPPTPMYLPGQRPYLFGYGATPKRAPLPNAHRRPAHPAGVAGPGHTQLLQPGTQGCRKNRHPSGEQNPARGRPDAARPATEPRADRKPEGGATQPQNRRAAAGPLPAPAGAIHPQLCGRHRHRVPGTRRILTPIRHAHRHPRLCAVPAQPGNSPRAMPRYAG